jgi:ligand-binding SRPBCC domain-containing protein
VLGPVDGDLLTLRRFQKSSDFDVSAETLFAFHERPDALALLTPPWQDVELLVPPKSLEIGTRVEMRVRVGPAWQTIVAEHVGYEPGRSFTDRMVRGPFAEWVHVHRVEALGPERARLVDDVTYRLPLGRAGDLAAGWFVRRQLTRLFDYRHEVTRREVTRPRRPSKE